MAGQFIKSILRDQGGNVLPLGAAGVMLLLTLVGSGVEMSRAYRADLRLQSACDAGALAGRRAVGVNGFDTAAQTVANNYFRTNFDETAQQANSTTFSFSSPDNGLTVNGTVSTRVPTLIMKVFGVGDLPLTATCGASMGVGNSDVTFVLDLSGSMGAALAGTTTTRLQALQSAMKNFYSTVSSATTNSTARVRYAMVPYSAAVNVGSILYARDPNFLADEVTLQSRAPVYRTISEQVFDRWSDPVITGPTTSFTTPVYTTWTNVQTYSSLSACNSGMPGLTATNSGTPTTTTTTVIDAQGREVTTTTVRQRQNVTGYRCVQSGTWIISYIRQRGTGTRDQVTTTTSTRTPIYTSVTRGEFERWEYRAVTYDTSVLKSGAPVSLPLGTNAEPGQFTWRGCIEERASINAPSFSFSSLTGIDPSGATDLDVDSAPSLADPGGRWRPLLQGLGYNRVTAEGGLTFNPAAVSPFGRIAQAYCPSAARLLGQMSQSEFFSYVDGLQLAGGTYHDTGMIWGARFSSPDGIFSDLVNQNPDNGGETARHLIFMTDGEMAPSFWQHSAYGMEWHDRRVSESGESSIDLTNRHNSRFLAVCEAVKAKGIRLWTIAFGTTLSPEMQTCASPNSSFLANDSSQLNVAFQEIAKKVGELRVVQ